MSIAHLPDDIVLVIFNCFETYLELLKSVSRVCKRWNHLARNHKILDQLTLKEIGIPIPITTMETSILWRDSTQGPSLMGKNSTEALHKIFTVINNQNSYKGLKTLRSPAEMRNSILGFIYEYSMNQPIFKLRNVIQALVLDYAKPEMMFDLINTIYITNLSSGQKITQAKATIDNLLAHFERTPNDEEIAGLESLQLTAFTEIIKIIKTFQKTYTLRVSYPEISTLRRFYQLKIGLLALLV